MSRTILAAVDDMFFAAKIRATAEALGVNIKFFRGVDALVAAAAEHSPQLILVDLHNEKLDPLELARSLRSHSGDSAIRYSGSSRMSIPSLSKRHSVQATIRLCLVQFSRRISQRF